MRATEIIFINPEVDVRNMRLPFFEKSLSDITLNDLVRAGFSDLKVGFGEGEIWGRENYRLIYDSIHDRVVRGYTISEINSKPMSIRQINEILAYVENLHHNQESK